MSDSKTRLYLVDDHALFREGLVRLLEAEPDFEVTGRAGTIGEAAAGIAAANPDIVILDADLGAETGLSLLPLLRAQSFAGRVLVVTAGIADSEAVQFVQAGAAGIFHKNKPPEALCDAIRQVASGDVFLEAHYLKPMFQAIDTARPDPRSSQLNEREARILRLIFQGASNKEIGDQLGLAESTVKAALRVLFDKLGVRTRSQLVKVALEQHRDQL